METQKNPIRVLELFAGIGGLHWALKVADIPYEIVAAVEINPTVMDTYALNFPSTILLRKNLQGITAKEISDLKVDAVVMSPPCQPFCRMGNRLDTEDNRTGPLTHLTKVLVDVQHLKYIFVENVQGFENSLAKTHLLETLGKLNFQWQEFMLTPKAVGVPNSRLRYYLIGKSKDLSWSFPLSEGQLLTEIPFWNDKECDNLPFSKMKQKREEETRLRRSTWKDMSDFKDVDLQSLPPCVGDIMEWNLSAENLERLKLSKSAAKKYYQAMDIVTPLSTNTCCFTKGYGHYVKGAGSILNWKGEADNQLPRTSSNANVEEQIEKLRYFSPREISRLMSYPDEFQFPDHLTLGQKYRSLGNSVNVYVVGILFSLLFS